MATVDNSGHVKVVGMGDALITVTTKDGTRNAFSTIKSIYHADVFFSNVLSSQGNGMLDAGFQCYIYDAPVYVKHIYIYDYSTDKEYVPNIVSDEDLGDWNHAYTISFSNLPTGYYKLKAVYERNGKEYTIYSSNVMKIS